jgi:N-acetylglucosaminyl-diphospho-decaprenol L-rhamnosyltransferase
MTEKLTLLSTIIVSYNTQELTAQALTAADNDIQASKVLKGKSELIVVDNHSTDETLEQLKKQKKQLDTPLTVIANDHNLGFASANNQGMAKAQGQYVLLLNSDTVIQPGALEHLVTTFEAHPIQESTAELESHSGQLDRLGIVAATLLNRDGSLQAQGGSFPNLLSLASHWLMLDDIPVLGQMLPSTQHTGRNVRQDLSGSHLVQQDWVGGTAMMIRREMIEEIGNLDDHIFMYGEDVEFCLRARKHHWDIAIDTQAQIIHYGSASSSSLNALRGEAKGYLYIWSKHHPLWQLPMARAILRLGCQLRVWLFGTIKGDQVKAKNYRSILMELKGKY